MAHELGRAVGYVNLTPYSPEHSDDVMGTAGIQPHDMVGYYFIMNADPYLFLHIRNLRSILPNCEPYWYNPD